MSGGRVPVTLITGAAGEIGQALLHRLAGSRGDPIVTVDLRSLSTAGPGDLHREHFQGDILDSALWEQLLCRYRPTLIFHLAAILSTRAESVPVLAHRVNADGAARLLAMAADLATPDEPVRFVFPSSIAVYGLPSRRPRRRRRPSAKTSISIRQRSMAPRSCTSNASARPSSGWAMALISGRCASRVSFPRTPCPREGTSDWAPELIHAAARGEPYCCFVDREARLPFCAMPDAVEGVLRLALRRKGLPDPERLQPGRAQPFRRRNHRARGEGFSGPRSPIPARPGARPDRGRLAGRGGRHRGPSGLRVFTRARRRNALFPVSDTGHPAALPRGRASGRVNWRDDPARPALPSGPVCSLPSCLRRWAPARISSLPG